jgi:ATP-dependent Clp protease ATP-binding subunit ClpC
MATDSAELSRIAAEALDIAKGAGQSPTTAHLLLATFTVPSAADVLLRERGCDEDRVLEELARARPSEAPEGFTQALDRARQIADDCGSSAADALHLLVALTRLPRSAAVTLLDRLINLASLRTTALGYLTGAVPRRRVPQEVRVTAPVERKTYARPAPVVPRMAIPAAAPAPSPATVVRPGVDAAPSVVATPPPAAVPAHRDEAPDAPEVSLSIGPLEVETVRAKENIAAPSSPPAPDAAQPWALDPREFPYLVMHGRNLSALAARRRLDPAVGREAEVEEVLDILGKRRANNPILVGEPGVGKTAIVEGLAQRLVELRAERIVIELDVAGLLAGTQLRGSFSERLLGIKDEVRGADGRIVVFIDELHMIIGAGATGEGPQDAANELKAALARGEFPCIGATTHDEFRRHVQSDPALERRFVPVLVREPSPRATVAILQGAAARYEEHHAVRFRAEALEAAALLTARYVRDRCLPDKAFAAIDLAGSRARREGRPQVTREDVARAVARMAGLPEERLLEPDGERFLGLERRLQESIVGHQEQLAAIARVVRRNYAGFSAQRPLASFLFVGPSGVGKTETARVLAEELYPAVEGGPQPGALVRIDLSEYSEPHSVARLVGAPPGYVGYGEGGQLTEAVRRRPACVVLLDEVEKAHPSVLQLLLQVLEEGQLTDGRGRRIDFSGTIVVLTSNVGASAFESGGRAVGFGAPDRQPSDSGAHPGTARALEQARTAFPPELWGRLDERLVFAPLGRDEIARIATLLLSDSSRRLWQERQIAFRTGPGLVDHLIAHGGWEVSLGARPMRQTIQRLVESPLADEILAGRIRKGAQLVACAGPSGVEFRPEG